MDGRFLRTLCKELGDERKGIITWGWGEEQ